MTTVTTSTTTTTTTIEGHDFHTVHKEIAALRKDLTDAQATIAAQQEEVSLLQRAVMLAQQKKNVRAQLEEMHLDRAEEATDL